KDVHDFLETRHLYHELGRLAFWKLHRGVKLDMEELKKKALSNPQDAALYVVERFTPIMDQMAAGADMSILLQEKEEELRLSRVDLMFEQQENLKLTAKLKSLESLYFTVTAIMCDKCRKEAMVALGLQYFEKMMGETMRKQLEEGKS
ncbi:MAG: hypothetical protein QMD10_11275, partial [Desulfitobacteriaceae bacterium]|nr:hypothetical protein [Desulfitobacteriaceae bacterium]